MTNKTVSINIIVLCITGLTCFVIASCVAVFVAVPDGANTGSLIALLLGSLPACVASIAVLAKVNETNKTIETATENTEKILNGTMDVKLRNAVHSVMDERDAAKS